MNKKIKDAVNAEFKDKLSKESISEIEKMMANMNIDAEEKIADALKPFIAIYAGVKPPKAEPKTKEKKEPTADPIIDPKQNDMNEQNEPEWKKAFDELAKRLATLTNHFQEQQNMNKSSLIAKQIREKAIEKKVPEMYINSVLEGRTFTDEAEAEVWQEKIQQQWEQLSQENANKRFGDVVPPTAGGDPIDDTKQIADIINKGTAEIITKNK